MTSDLLSFTPFGLRTPTSHCRWDRGEEEASAHLTIDGVAGLETYQKGDLRAQAAGRHILAATGRDRLHLTDLRHIPAPGFAAATARLTGFHQWLTVTAQRADVKALGSGAEQTSSLWLSAVVSLREQTLNSGEQQWIWLLGLDDSQRVQLQPDGRVYLEEVPTGLNRLIDLVQKEMSLHFRSSAFDLLFNEDFDWEDAPAGILAEFVEPLKRVTTHHALGHVLAVVGLGPRLAKVAASIARHVGMVPWSPPPDGSFAPKTASCAVESWLLRETAEREALDQRLTAGFDGAPLLLPAPEGREAGVDSAAPFAAPSAGAELLLAVDAAPAAMPGEEGSGGQVQRRGQPAPHQRRRRSWLRHHAGKPRRARADESSLRKIVFVVVWVLAVTFAGHLLVEQSAESERARQAQGGP